MSAEIRDDGYVKNHITKRWLKPGGKAYKDYMASFGGAEAPAAAPAAVVAEPVAAAVPKVRKPRIKKAATPPPEPDFEPEADELAPELSDADNIEMSHLTEADFTDGLEAVRSGLAKCDSFQVAPEPPAPKVRKPRKPRAKKAA